MRTPLRASQLASIPLNGAKVVSAYSGCGGLDMGFRLAGFELSWANDIDPVAVETYNATLGPHAVAGDIGGVPWPHRGSADLVVGGPPCQGFSVAGKMNPHDPRSKHVERFFDFVEHVSPSGFVMENVKALAISARWSSVRRRLEERANQLQYRTSMLILNAADFGAPQRRQRMFLVGLRDGQQLTTVLGASESHLTVREALASLPRYGEPGNDTVCTAGITPAKRPVLRPTAYRGSLLFNGNGRPLRLDSTAPTLPAAMGGNATPILDQRELESGVESWVVAYHRRLLAGGRPLRTVPRYLRRITVEEAAHLQGFPLGTRFIGSTSAKYRQIGNAVPPPLAYAVARAVARVIGIDTPNFTERLAA